ncbi:tetratricopeptide repeat protein [Janthinobacterium sp. 17J80-10]|uniref:tetratricopeptide repeat protein n=1 Tax=Janthinobacterium sp. 17J80-10 TaxID=2497863 RepID=UPI0013E8D580|nr:tetratricopeptide repeat protein [Janthinobacterium sp. 17J80-10]
MGTSSITAGLASISQRRLLAIAAFSLSLLSGCATTASVGADGQPSIEPLMGQAESELAKGRRDQAIALLNQAAKESPTNVAPWLRMANIWFDDANYPSSILAANEALARDDSNQEAKSLLVVSGLRIAAKAVQGLVPHNPVNPNARQEAENLTKSLRLALGEKVLVPAESDKPAAQAPRARKKVTARMPAAGKADATPVAVAAPAAAVAPAATPAAASAPAPTVAAAPAAAPVAQKVSASVQSKAAGPADPFKSLK